MFGCGRIACQAIDPTHLRLVTRSPRPPRRARGRALPVAGGHLPRPEGISRGGRPFSAAGRQFSWREGTFHGRRPSPKPRNASFLAARAISTGPTPLSASAKALFTSPRAFFGSEGALFLGSWAVVRGARPLFPTRKPFPSARRAFPVTPPRLRRWRPQAPMARIAKLRWRFVSWVRSRSSQSCRTQNSWTASTTP